MRLPLLILFILVAFKIYGQSPQIDSLQQRLEKEPDPKRKVELLNKLSFAFFDFDIEKANSTTLKSLRLAKEIGDKEGEGWALAYRGLYFFLSGNLMESLTHFEQSLSIANKVDNKDLQMYSLTQFGNVFRDKGSFDSALFFYQKAEQKSLESKNDYYSSNVKINLTRYYLLVQKPDEALSTAKECLKIRENLKDSLLIGDIWIVMGNCYRAKDDYVEAERYYQKVFPLTNRDSILQGEYLKNMGEIYFRSGDFLRAMKNWNQVLSYYRGYHYKYALAELLLRIGTVFEQQGYYDLSVEYLNSALEISEQAHYQYLVGKIYHEYAWVYFWIKDYQLALLSNKKEEDIFNKTGSELELASSWDLRGLIERRLKKYDSSLYYHNKSLAERTRIGNKVDISAGLFNIGEFYIDTQDYKLALSYFVRSLQIDRGLGDNYGISLNYNRIGKIYTQLSVYDSAQFYLDKSIELAIPTSSNEIFRSNFIDMAGYYERIGEPEKAIQYYKKYYQLTDSTFSKETAQSLAAYRTLYDVERNEQELSLLNKENQLGKAKVKEQRIILTTAIAGVIILMAMAVFYYRFSQKQKRINQTLAEKNDEIQVQSEELLEANTALSELNVKIAEQKEEIQAQAEELTESNQTIVGINEVLEERIEERTSELKQAFKELDTFFYRSSHDFRRPLTTFMGLAEVARVLVKDPTALELFDKVNENAQNLDKMLRKLQSISDVGAQEHIYKEVFMKEIFEMELHKLKPELDSLKIKTVLSVKLEAPFYSYTALVKIIVQNLLENSVAFCSSTAQVIQLSAYEMLNEVVLEVQDNGLGIEPEYLDRVFEMYYRANEHSKGNGLGLYIVKKTVQKLNGRIELKSQVGSGTTVMVYFPHNLS